MSWSKYTGKDAKVLPKDVLQLWKVAQQLWKFRYLTFQSCQTLATFATLQLCKVVKVAQSWSGHFPDVILQNFLNLEVRMERPGSSTCLLLSKPTFGWAASILSAVRCLLTSTSFSLVKWLWCRTGGQRKSLPRITESRHCGHELSIQI